VGCILKTIQNASTTAASYCPYLGKAPGSDAISNWVYRALPVSYDWVPTDTPRSETAVNAPVVGVQQTNASR